MNGGGNAGGVEDALAKVGGDLHHALGYSTVVPELGRADKDRIRLCGSGSYGE
jgi:hypothetical protein